MEDHFCLYERFLVVMRTGSGRFLAVFEITYPFGQRFQAISGDFRMPEASVGRYFEKLKNPYPFFEKNRGTEIGRIAKNAQLS